MISRFENLIWIIFCNAPLVIAAPRLRVLRSIIQITKSVTQESEEQVLPSVVKLGIQTSGGNTDHASVPLHAVTSSYHCVRHCTRISFSRSKYKQFLLEMFIFRRIWVEAEPHLTTASMGHRYLFYSDSLKDNVLQSTQVSFNECLIILNTLRELFLSPQSKA